MIFLSSLSGMGNYQLVGDGKHVGDTVRASFWGKEVPAVGYLPAEVMDCSVPLLFPVIAFVHFGHSNSQAPGTDRGRCRGIRGCGPMAHTSALQLCFSVPSATVPAVPAQGLTHCLGFIDWPSG